MPTDLGRVARGPGPFHPRTLGRALPGLRAAALASTRATGICRRPQASIRHALSGVIEAAQVAACSNGSDSHRPLHATEGLQRVHDRAEPPGGAWRVECLCQTLDPVSLCGDRPDLCWEDDVLGGGGTDALAQPAQVRWSPGGPTGRADSMPQQQGFEAERGRLALMQRLFPRAAQVTQSVVLDRGDSDRREVPCAHPARQLAGIAPLRFDTVAGLLREQGRGNTPAAVAFCGQRAREPRAARAGCRDQDERLALGLQWPDERVDRTLPDPDRAKGDDGCPTCLGDLGNRDGRFLDIHSDVERARRSHG